MKIADIVAYPVSVPVPKTHQVTLGIGTLVKRDTVIVKVTTDDGLVGWGESHHGRAHLAIAALVNTTLKQLVLGMSATDVNGVWQRIYKFQLGEPWHGRRLRDGDERDRHRALGYQGQSRRLAALPAAGRCGARHSGLCRRHFARLPAARIAGRGSRRVRRRRLRGGETAHRRYAGARRRARGARCVGPMATGW